ncbi:hypothetical protein [Saccharothrix coeruleofusca]|uniref:DUF4232 domain-containing protein n=1 Tax=Saccharothrix coeruleofusca TaxID=33919 RepID=A0A918AJN5_9PSEU|nr:hypothetical protein [Saccharothrix coeruleofusca]GGP45457.1 hypothetical protein GCM10010185_16550 [Saccharothrix coeruleofusca]
MNVFRKTLTAAALTSAALLAVAGTSAASAGNAQSANSDVPWCTDADLNVRAHDGHSPNSGSKLFIIELAAKEGVSCKIGGPLSNVRFFDAKGELDVALTVGRKPEYVEVPVNSQHSAVVYAATPSSGPSVTPTGISFDLPGKGQLAGKVKIAWPSDLRGPVTFGHISYWAS